MTDQLREPGFVTEHQLRAVLHDGNFFLVACPGSGKTRAGGVRFARLAEEGVRVAATSYTNVGVEQIRSVVSGALGVTVGPQHFVGTLHGFLLRYVFYPFGHLVMGCDGSPRLLADEAGWPDVVFGGNHRIRSPVSRFHFRPDGSLCYRGLLPRGIRSPEDAASSGQAQALRLKGTYARQGVASPDDSMYWSLRVLQERRDIAAVVAGRFAELQVDEAQDTSALQLAAVRELCGTGALSSLVMIGDVEQSIFSFQGASPEGCRSLARDRGLEVIELSENHRSSQRICDVAVNFCRRDEPDRAVGKDADCPWSPELFLYDPEHPDQAIHRYRERLAVLGIAPHDAAVLARGNVLVDELNAQHQPVACDPRPLALGRAAAMVQGAGTLTRRQIETVDRALAYTAWDAADLNELDAEKRVDVRRNSIALLADLPPVEGNLRDWIRAAAGVVGVHVAGLVDELKHSPGQAFRSSPAQAGTPASAVFAPPPRSLKAQTVHDVKGDSRDAVLVVADRPRSRARGAQSMLWGRLLMGEAIPDDEAEELRIVYVALTRARRYCALALPADTPTELVERFEAAGFERLAPVDSS